jgi:hypothetical protein
MVVAVLPVSGFWTRTQVGKEIQDEAQEWNQKQPLNRKVHPTSLIIPVVTELKWIAKGEISWI